MKKYQFEKDGKTITKNVSPEKEQAFLAKYGKYNPTAVQEETSWWKGEEGWVPDEFEFWKKKREQETAEQEVEVEEESPGKSEGTSQSQNNQQENTVSYAGPGSSDSPTEETEEKQSWGDYAKDKLLGEELKGDTQEKNTWIEDYFGKRKVTDFVGDVIRNVKSGGVQSEVADPALEFWKEGKNISDEDLRELVEKGKAMEEHGPTDELIALMIDTMK